MDNNQKVNSNQALNSMIDLLNRELNNDKVNMENVDKLVKNIGDMSKIIDVSNANKLDLETQKIKNENIAHQELIDNQKINIEKEKIKLEKEQLNQEKSECKSNNKTKVLDSILNGLNVAGRLAGDMLKVYAFSSLAIISLKVESEGKLITPKLFMNCTNKIF